MVVNAKLPISLPKLCLWIYYEEPLDAAWDDFLIVVYAPGEEKPIFKATFPLGEWRKECKEFVESERSLSGASDGDVEAVHIRTVPVVLSPFVLRHEGNLRVRGHYRGEILKLGALLVRSRPQT
jgi:hypothetical protein